MDFGALSELEKVDVAQIPDVLGRLEVTKARLYARLSAAAAEPPPGPLEQGTWLEADDVSSKIGLSSSWVRKHGHQLPGFKRISANRVRWWSPRLTEWLSSGAPWPPVGPR